MFSRQKAAGRATWITGHPVCCHIMSTGLTPPLLGKLCCDVHKSGIIPVPFCSNLHLPEIPGVIIDQSVRNLLYSFLFDFWSSEIMIWSSSYMLLPKARIPPNITALANRFFTLNGPLSVQLFTFAGRDSLLRALPLTQNPVPLLWYHIIRRISA